MEAKTLLSCSGSGHFAVPWAHTESIVLRLAHARTLTLFGCAQAV